MSLNAEGLNDLQLDENNTVGELYGAVSYQVTEAIDGITEAMRGNVLYVRSVRRGPFMDLQRTRVGARSTGGIPLRRERLLTRWAMLGTQDQGFYRVDGNIVHTDEVIAGSAQVTQYYGEESPVTVRVRNARGHVEKAAFNPALPLEALEPSRRALLLHASQVVVAHAAAVEQINAGGAPTDVLAALHMRDAALQPAG